MVRWLQPPLAERLRSRYGAVQHRPADNLPESLTRRDGLCRVDWDWSCRYGRRGDALPRGVRVAGQNRVYCPDSLRCYWPTDGLRRGRLIPLRKSQAVGRRGGRRDEVNARLAHLVIQK